jgi:hypothetical protein
VDEVAVMGVGELSIAGELIIGLRRRADANGHDVIAPAGRWR